MNTSGKYLIFNDDSVRTWSDQTSFKDMAAGRIAKRAGYWHRWDGTLKVGGGSIIPRLKSDPADLELIREAVSNP